MLRPTAENQDPLDAAWPGLLALAAGETVEAPADCPLWALYAPIASGRAGPAFVVGQLGQSLDGRVATATGKSRDINGPEGIRHLHRLRALVDAVVVGVGTVIADDPQLTVRKVKGPSPARVVIDPNFRLPAQARLLHDGQAPVFTIQAEAGARPAGVEAIVVPRTGDAIAPADMVAALAARGFRRILVEGGAATVSAFLAAGALHRFHLSIAPMVIGSGPVGINLPPIDELDAALRPSAVTHQLGGDVLFDCAFATPAAEGPRR
jgi:diaminohydroxyphosphoribosylaminopyrimidine deaminase/5-amino-6-(5-phosphoribosylamino)uracil reductase